MEKLLLSCDTGIDDALALAYAAGQNEMEFIGVCATYGVASIQNAYRNSRFVLSMLGCDVPVWMGSNKPLQRPELDYANRGSMFHGSEGLGNILPQAGMEDIEGATAGEAVDRIIELVHRYKKDLVIVTTGPLTDLARACQKDPSIIGMVGRVVSMGGAFATPGNSSPYAEANIRMDPEAAKLVLAMALPLTMVGLDVTRKTLLCNDDLARWRGMGTNAASTLANSVQTYLKAYAERYPYLAGCALHDPLAVGVALHPEWVTTLPMHATCITEGEAEGRTCEDLDRLAEKEYTTQCAFLLDTPKFENHFYETVETVLKEAN